LRQLGEAARREIEELTQSKLFLELRVKVNPGWRRDEKALKQFGYSKT
jgi:GTP-binding protein Era